MAAFLHFILVMILTAGFIVGIAVYIIYTRVSKAARHFRDQMDGTANNGHRSKQTRTAHGEIIIDNRTPSEAGRKIFSKDEGEYIDFEEEKNT